MSLHILITGARAPVAVELVRALAAAGHTVFAADSLPGPTLAGSSRACAGYLQLPPPRQRFAAFAQALHHAVARLGITLIIPTCEEVFYLAQVSLPPPIQIFCPALPSLARWHHKGQFQALAAARGLLTPPTILVEHPAALRAALRALPSYLLKPAYSRFATRLITNRGPQAGLRPLTACQPSSARPWLAQSFVTGTTLCSYSLVHRGHVTAHCAYVTPTTAGAGAGTAFVSVDGQASLAVVQALVDPSISGQVALDFMLTPQGRLVLLECNPRATSGVHLLEPAALVGGLLDPHQPTWIAPAGQRRQLSAVTLPTLALQLLQRPWHSDRWHNLATGLATPDVLFRPDDPGPSLAQVAQVAHFARLAAQQRIGLLAATTYDIEWNGHADY
ncbi:MAG: hypothetical protein AB4911_17525 [Oscillochloridaceae bacterium umkhey_bin13]